MLVVKETRIPTPVLLQKLWNCLQTAHMAVKLRIAVAIQLQSIRMIKRHMQRSTIKRLRGWVYQRSTSDVEIAKSEMELNEPIIVGVFSLQYAKL